jgi:hypothetical protein
VQFAFGEFLGDDSIEVDGDVALLETLVFLLAGVPFLPFGLAGIRPFVLMLYFGYVP